MDIHVDKRRRHAPAGDLANTPTASPQPWRRRIDVIDETTGQFGHVKATAYKDESSHPPAASVARLGVPLKSRSLAVCTDPETCMNVTAVRVRLPVWCGLSEVSV